MSVSEKVFDDFHLYTLGRPLYLKDKETKQVEFIRRTGIKAKKEYRYSLDLNLFRDIPSEPESPVVIWKFANTEANQLGLPLPAGTARFYRSDSQDQNLEFVGEDKIDHTPKNQDVSLTTGKAFDLKAALNVVNFSSFANNSHYQADIKITLKNSAAEEREITTACAMQRGWNMKVTSPSEAFTSIDADSLEFKTKVPAEGEKIITFHLEANQ